MSQVPDFTNNPAGYRAYIDGLLMYAVDKKATPSNFYTPHKNGQEQFHRAPHKVRMMAPGNRWGKTRALGIETDDYMQHRTRFREKPTHPIQGIWFCVDFGQFDLLRPLLDEECFTSGWKWNDNDKVYSWPNGSKLHVKSDVRDWSYIQGTNPDLVIIDEECPVGLYRELRARGYGKRDTRYIIGATATNMAGSWMEKEIYRPWLDYHQEAGLDQSRAVLEQRHPEIWCWPKGGIQDNPSMSTAQVASFHNLRWAHEKEKQVRDQGGFANWFGDGVFDDVSIDWLREQRKELLKKNPGWNVVFDVRAA